MDKHLQKKVDEIMNKIPDFKHVDSYLKLGEIWTKNFWGGETTFISKGDNDINKFIEFVIKNCTKNLYNKKYYHSLFGFLITPFDYVYKIQFMNEAGASEEERKVLSLMTHPYSNPKTGKMRRIRGYNDEIYKTYDKDDVE